MGYNAQYETLGQNSNNFQSNGIKYSDEEDSSEEIF